MIGKKTNFYVKPKYRDNRIGKYLTAGMYFTVTQSNQFVAEIVKCQIENLLIKFHLSLLHIHEIGARILYRVTR